MRITHVLDTSAILAHYFGEEGAGAVDQLWTVDDFSLGVSVLTLPELWTRLHACLEDMEEADNAFDSYINHLTTALPVTRDVAELSIVFRNQTDKRLPLVDAVIAATAKARNAILFHSDPHLSQIPAAILHQVCLRGE